MRITDKPAIVVPPEVLAARRHLSQLEGLKHVPGVEDALTELGQVAGATEQWACVEQAWNCVADANN